MNANPFTTYDDADLLRLLDQLQGNERDLRRRLATRVAELGNPGPPISDPIYQQLFFALDSIEAQRAVAESELAQRVTSPLN
jgi:hypothetical protein